MLTSYVGVLALRLLVVCLGVVIRHGVLVGVGLGGLLLIALAETDGQEAREEDNLVRTGERLLAADWQVLTFNMIIVETGGDSRTLEQDCSPQLFIPISQSV